MNGFGRLFRVALFGESHGAGIGLVLEGCPSGLALGESDFTADLRRRRPGARHGTPRKEADLPQILSGCLDGKTTGAPIAIHFANTNVRSSDYKEIKAQPRPGHADWVASVKYGPFADPRGGGHFSGRMTVALVAAGVIAKKILGKKVTIQAEVVEVGGETNCKKGLARAEKENDSVGGIVACKVNGLPAGLGEPFFDTAEGQLAHALMAIPAVKGIEFGNGFAAARLLGSQNNDVYVNARGRTATQHAGGFSGGLTNGNPIFFRIPIKPTSSTPKTQHTWNTETQDIRPLSLKGRHDRCIALRVPVIVEAITACVFVDLMMQAQQIPRILVPN